MSKEELVPKAGPNKINGDIGREVYKSFQESTWVPVTWQEAMTDLEYVDALEIRDYGTVAIAFYNKKVMGAGDNTGEAVIEAIQNGRDDGIIERFKK